MRTVISYPKFLAHIMKQKLHNEMRLWIAMKMFDDKGQGRYTEDQLKDLFCNKGDYHLFSSKRLKGILHSGNDVFWKYYPEHKVIFHFSPKRIAENLECETVGSHQVIIPVDVVFAHSITVFKSFCHQAFLATTKESPISRNKLESIIGVSDDTMRHYEKVSFDDKTNIRTKNNYILLCEGYNPDSAQYQELIYQYGNVVRINYQDKVYTAYRTANSYLSPIELVNVGKTQRKAINHYLSILWHKTGNMVNKVFYTTSTRGCENGNYILEASKFRVNMNRKSKFDVVNLWLAV